MRTILPTPPPDPAIRLGDIICMVLLAATLGLLGACWLSIIVNH